MFDSAQILVILVVALVLIGPKHLPDIMRVLAKGINEVRRMTTDVRSTLEREIQKADEAVRIEEARKELFDEAPAPQPAAVTETAVTQAEAHAPQEQAADGTQAHHSGVPEAKAEMADAEAQAAPSVPSNQGQEKSHA